MSALLRLFVPLIVLTIMPLSTAVSCGGTVSEDEMLFENLSCPCARGAGEAYIAVTVVGPARLLMNGKTISCDNNSFIYGDQGAVIEVIGTNGYVGKGRVEGGNFGIRLAGEGGHTVEKVTVEATGDDSILVSSSDNLVISNILSDCGQGLEGDTSGDCIDIEFDATNNRVERNFIMDWGDDGIDCDGSFNMIKDNIIDNTATFKLDTENGITLRGTENLILNNKIYNTKGDGIQVKYDEPDEDCTTPFTGGKNRVVGNMVTGAKTGFRIKSDGNIVANNYASGCDKDGLKVDKGKCSKDKTNPSIGGNNNLFLRNMVTRNKEDGYEIEGKDNMFTGNVAEDNGENGFKIEGPGNFFMANIASGNAVDFLDESE